MLDSDQSKSLSVGELKEVFGGEGIHDMVWEQIILEHQTNETGNNNKEVPISLYSRSPTNNSTRCWTTYFLADYNIPPNNL